jgi:hypothetical protein
VSVWGTVDSAWASRNAKRGAASEEITVPRVDIDNVFREYGVPYYLKIDVEGVDLLVLASLGKLQARPQYVSIESEKVKFPALVGEMDLLESLGYKKFKIVQQAHVPDTNIKTKALDGTEFEHWFEEHASGPFGEDVPGEWISRDDALNEYKKIFRRYRYFGDQSLVIRLPPALALRYMTCIVRRLAIREHCRAGTTLTRL